MSAALAAEWLKLRTLRGTWAALACVGLAMAGLAALTGYAAGMVARHPELEMTPVEPLASQAAQLALGIVGVLCVTSEHSPGTLRQTLLATPWRGRLVAAKAGAAGGLALAAGLVAVVGSSWLDRAVAGDHVIRLFSDAVNHSPRVLAAYVLVVPATALSAVGLALCLRSTAAAVTALVVVLEVAPIVLQAVPGPAGTWLRSLQPAALAEQVAAAGNLASIYGHALPVVAAAALLVGYPGMLLAAGTVRLRRTDA